MPGLRAWTQGLSESWACGLECCLRSSRGCGESQIILRRSDMRRALPQTERYAFRLGRRRVPEPRILGPRTEPVLCPTMMNQALAHVRRFLLLFIRTPFFNHGYTAFMPYLSREEYLPSGNVFRFIPVWARKPGRSHQNIRITLHLNVRLATWITLV